MKYILFLAACLTFSVCSAQIATYYATDSSGTQIVAGTIFQVQDSLGNVKYVSLPELRQTFSPQIPAEKQNKTLLTLTIFTFLGLLAGATLTL